MNKEKVYLDSGVIIQAFRNKSHKAFKIIDDNNYEFYISDAVYLEVIPKAKFNKQEEEIKFYEKIFKNFQRIEWDLNALTDAKNLAETYGLNAMDAIHISHAITKKIDKIFTTEKDTKPMFKVEKIKIESIIN